MNFTAIDFETANGQRNSACSLGLVRVENGLIVESKDWLISPPEMYFHPMNVSIHGITEEDVMNKPSFNYIWEEVEDYLHGKMVIAHNASFDVSVLRACLETYNIRFPEFDYLCTVQICRNIWPNMPNHKLNTIAHLFDIPLRHHDALEDTLACAKIAIKACEVMNMNSLTHLAHELRIAPGKLNPNGYKAPKKIK
ncbi:exonuclease domain-containing protein [Labilibaculum sp. K2S]|uniref:exonuclease domain-containing protein n=1 Tax=Labilibaculum sp. K2S TaxID=3056386 RepID=UPI0025A382B3|nr:exonuclease domain-containing protein [Labilibaculum sp. K2S]MDM8158505.1 exonuclease domain-containing protein [Labilibaculum sp. K2S]